MLHGTPSSMPEMLERTSDSTKCSSWCSRHLFISINRSNNTMLKISKFLSLIHLRLRMRTYLIDRMINLRNMMHPIQIAICFGSLPKSWPIQMSKPMPTSRPLCEPIRLNSNQDQALSEQKNPVSIHWLAPIGLERISSLGIPIMVNGRNPCLPKPHILNPKMSS